MSCKGVVLSSGKGCTNKAKTHFKYGKKYEGYCASQHPDLIIDQKEEAIKADIRYKEKVKAEWTEREAKYIKEKTDKFCLDMHLRIKKLPIRSDIVSDMITFHDILYNTIEDLSCTSKTNIICIISKAYREFLCALDKFNFLSILKDKVSIKDILQTGVLMDKDKLFLQKFSAVYLEEKLQAS